MKKTIRKTVQRILSAKKLSWSVLIRSLQASCLLLLITAALLLFDIRNGDLRHLQTAYRFRDLSQLALLLGVIVPPCLEELDGQERGRPPGSSGR